MSKEEHSRHEIVSVDATHHQAIVAEGTGKTAANEGAKQKEVYNVSREGWIDSPDIGPPLIA
ncbi:uncharacterized protein LDX57_012693 [Aspergillus melleus]|uniref:uncharacterized protein n=1 Tax=Aspergillus melleus TaxID=138277 RepID=UPI001E8E6DB9|nr:uncharacterized protein LDX57_012693 [Aspergillus melleus]KAH8435064.1 hypothetical protein LDX57_012693 [Aspergillus melleus]